MEKHKKMYFKMGIRTVLFAIFLIFYFQFMVHYWYEATQWILNFMAKFSAAVIFITLIPFAVYYILIKVTDNLLKDD